MVGLAAYGVLHKLKQTHGRSRADCLLAHLFLVNIHQMGNHHLSDAHLHLTSALCWSERRPCPRSWLHVDCWSTCGQHYGHGLVLMFFYHDVAVVICKQRDVCKTTLVYTCRWLAHELQQRQFWLARAIHST